ncbi:MAG TPA: hypothetical protein VK427_25345 [Kofleriaceae bacterium]|nr:hypothetical protein [Kofleriaceae bacterium]
MRTLALAAVLTSAVIACRAASGPEAPAARTRPGELALDVEPALRERLALGIPLHLELHVGGAPVGACTVTYDLWAENYRVSLSPSHATRSTTSAAALEQCVDPERMERLGRERVAHVVVREVPGRAAPVW